MSIAEIRARSRPPYAQSRFTLEATERAPDEWGANRGHATRAAGQSSSPPSRGCS